MEYSVDDVLDMGKQSFEMFAEYMQSIDVDPALPMAVAAGCFAGFGMLMYISIFPGEARPEYKVLSEGEKFEIMKEEVMKPTKEEEEIVRKQILKEMELEEELKARDGAGAAKGDKKSTLRRRRKGQGSTETPPNARAVDAVSPNEKETSNSKHVEKMAAAAEESSREEARDAIAQFEQQTGANRERLRALFRGKTGDDIERMSSSPMKSCLSWVNCMIPVALILGIFYFLKRDHGIDGIQILAKLFPREAGVIRKFAG